MIELTSYKVAAGNHYLKDVVKGLVADYDKKTIHKAVNELILEDKLMWFSTGSSSMVCLPRFHKG